MMFFFSFSPSRCLGLKSPFIEFKSGLETLSNLSISLNASDSNGFGQSMMSGNLFSYAFEEAGNRSIQRYYLDLVKKQQKPSILSTASPVISKKEIALALSQHNNGDKRFVEFIDRKYADPMALKKPPTVILTTTTTTTTTTTRKPVLPDSSPNIDDLKRHLLMLQNLTRNDENFQSKFVVFPSLQKPTAPSTTISPNIPIMPTTQTLQTTEKSTTATTKKTTTTTTIATSTKRTTTPSPPARKSITLNVSKQTPSPGDDSQKIEKISIVPQVFLQNDQTLMNDDSFERPVNDERYQRQRSRINDPKPAFLSATTKQHLPDGKSKKMMNENRNRVKQLRREMRKKCKTLPFEQRQNCTNQVNPNGNGAKMMNSKREKSINKSINDEITSNRSRPPYATPTTATITASTMDLPSGYSRNTETPTKQFNNRRIDDDPLKRSERNVRSNRRHQRRNATTSTSNSSILQRRNQSYLVEDPTSSMTMNGETITADIAASIYKEKIDLNPDLCFKIGGLSYGQQKLCASNTQIMPAISRGARAAIQVINTICFYMTEVFIDYTQIHHSFFVSFSLFIYLLYLLCVSLTVYV